MFYSNLSEVIKNDKINKAELSRRIGIAKSSFDKWEQGSSPRFVTVVKLSEALDVSLDYLAYGAEKNKSKMEKCYDKATDEEKKIIDTILKKYSN